MKPAAAWAGLSAGLLALGLYPVLIHTAVVSGAGTGPATVFALVQAGVTGLALARTAKRYRWMALIGVAGLAVTSWYSARDGLLAASGISHAMIYLGLLALFGNSLAAGREPLITAIARKVRGYLTPEMEIYTRRVTWAWCLFCGAQLAGSLVLLATATDETWSFFVNVMDLPLLLTMFAVEYCWRLYLFWNYPHGSILDIVRVFMEEQQSGSRDAA
ncbi:putative membrane protein [Skermanella aerolata]|jgi:uncharacterized membrane protein|uniref:Transmembrane protein n=1 Tax=Skermanella aerolata TaxID=393310 RepID=A0A512DXK9_9PROT|nr:hypothetical protein [Skermanella aerolata]GEO41212.1 hypothetical protein SAE02_53600 [Skermanella aerolata]